MRYLALACDYDGTLAWGGVVAESTLAALRQLRAGGRRIILVTGRELTELLTVFPEIDVCDLVVAENGGVLYRPSTREQKLLADPPPSEFIRELQTRQVPLSVGRVLIATHEPHETTVLTAIRDLGLEWQVIFNKGAVMVLPSGVNKATGLAAALSELQLSPHNVVGIGDAENDHAFLRSSECSVAVANALPTVKEQADLVMAGDHGTGVVQLITMLMENDLQDEELRLARHHVLAGTAEDGQEVRIAPYGENVLLAGTSGSGKSTLAAGLLERMAEHKYQFCVIDPEGDYGDIGGAVVLGDAHRPPSVEEVFRLLKDPTTNAVVNLVGLPLTDRPGFFLSLLPRIQELRASTGRPHWLLVDEAHHVLPATWKPAPAPFPLGLMQLMFITVHPEAMAAAALAIVHTAIAVGNTPEVTLREIATRIGHASRALSFPRTSLDPGHAVLWKISDDDPIRFQVTPSHSQRLRHRRKYAEGNLGPDRSFYFTGPDNKLNLRAQNLMLFMQLAEGVDEDTWLHHLTRQDYSRWFREAIKDETLAEEAAEIEQTSRDAGDSRERIKALITQHYTLPASAPAALPGSRTVTT